MKMESKTFCVNEDGTATMHIEVDDRAEQDVDIVTAVYDDNGKMLTASFGI